jgi:mRNA interferase RelE/StbE
MLKVVLGVSARRFLKKCDKQLYKHLLEKIKLLQMEPFPRDVKRIQGKKGATLFRVRVGDYRVQYVVFQEKNELLVTDIDKRARVYS